MVGDDCGIMGENHKTYKPYSIILFFGSYDIPIKGSDHAGQWESEEVYDYLICAICDLVMTSLSFIEHPERLKGKG